MTDKSYSELRSKTITGVQWNAVSQIGGQGLTVIGSVILSRLLLPEYFGLFAMISVLGNVLNLLIALGFSHAVIQNQQLSREDSATLFWLNILAAGIVGAIFYFSVPFIVDFYEQPALLQVSRTFSLVFVVCAAGVVPTALLARDINFKKLALSNLTAILMSYALGIYLAFSGFGLWSLLCQYACFHTVTFLMNAYYARWMPRPRLAKSPIQKVGSFSAGLLPSQLLDFFTSNIDIVLVGKYLGKRPLGLYGRAQSIIMLPVTNLSILLARSFFALFSSLQGKPEALRTNFINSTKVMVIITAPLLLGIAVVAKEFVLVLFGEPWLPMAPLVSILCVGGVMASFNAMSDAMLTSQGRTGRLLKVVSVEKFVLVILIVAGIFFGIIGVALARVAAQLFSLVFRIHQQQEIVHLGIRDWMRSFWRLAVALVVMVTVSWLIAFSLSQGILWVRFILPPAAAAIVFIGCLALLREPILRTLKNLALDKLKSVW